MDTLNPNQMPPLSRDLNKKSRGPLIAVIIILALIIVGGLYFLKERASQNNYTVPAETEDNVTASLRAQSNSDDLDSIEADLNAENFDNLDQGAAVIESEIQ